MIFTKNARLGINAGRIKEVFEMPESEKMRELEYMVNTIKSSWEFFDITFSIEGVSRAFTHQFVRNRLGSYAQQTMRIIDMKDFEYITGPSIQTDQQRAIYDGAMADINDAYKTLIECGVKEEDARGILPTNISTNIVAKFNLRALSDMMASRASCRTQSEYRDVLDAIYDAMVKAHPWTAEFLRDSRTYACNKLESIIRSDYDGTLVLNDYIKLIDQVRNG